MALQRRSVRQIKAKSPVQHSVSAKRVGRARCDVSTEADESCAVVSTEQQRKRGAAGWRIIEYGIGLLACRRRSQGAGGQGRPLHWRMPARNYLCDDAASERAQQYRASM